MKNGSVTLSEEEKQEMLEDAGNLDRGRVFNAARTLHRPTSLDEFINFLTMNSDLATHAPRPQKTANNKL